MGMKKAFKKTCKAVKKASKKTAKTTKKIVKSDAVAYTTAGLLLMYAYSDSSKD